LLIDVTSDDLKPPKVRADAYDVLFMDGVGSANKLDHEIESYTSGTGHLVAWVRIPTLSSTVDTVFYMYYGNPSAANQQNKVGVWDSRFVMVQHLSETTGTHYDSTSHHNDGTPTGGLSQGVAGKIDGADNFDGIDDRVDVLNNPDNSLNFGTGDFTLSVWIKYASCGDTDVTRKGNMNVSPQMSYKMECSSNVITATLEGSNSGGGGTLTDNAARGDNNWHNAVFMRNAGTISLYVDGALKASQGAANMDLTSTANVAIGAKPPPISPGNDWFTGMIDEVRYSNVGLGADWITTSYNSMNSPSTFYRMATEEQKPASFDFSLANSGGITVTQGGSGSNTITATLTTGSTQSVGLSCTSGLPTGATCGFSPASGSPTFSSTLTISALSSTPTGPNTITVTGTAGTLTHTTTFQLTVNAPQNVPTVTVTGAYHGARLTWTDVGALSYNIYYSLSSDVSSATQYTTGVTGTTFDVKDLLSATWDKTCYYWVAPVGSGGEAAKSSWGMGSDKVWAYKIEITSVTAVKQVAGDLKVNVQYRSRYLGSEGITVGVQIGEFLGPGTVSDVPNRLISITSTNPIALSSFMSTGTFNSESTSSEFVRGSSYKAWVFLWNQLPSDPGYWEPYATKAELIPITIS
jgi:hypothetical protein